MPTVKLLSLFLLSFLISTATSHAEPMDSDATEGFDRQTPAEIEAARAQITALFGGAIHPATLSPAEKSAILNKYRHVDPRGEVPSALLEQTLLYFDKNMSKFSNQDYVSVVNFKPHSSIQRFFVIDLKTGAVEKFRTTHGWASDADSDGNAETFGNVVSSGKSSLGFVRTGEVYWGKFKRSIRLDGLSSTNSNVRERAIVVHGWDKAFERNVTQGLSWGCPALDWLVKDGVIDKIKEGSLMNFGYSN